MNINFIVPEISRTGGMNVIFQYANRLKKKGHRVCLFSPVIPFNLHKGTLRPYYLKYQFKYAGNLVLNGRKPPANIYPYNFEIKYVFSVRNPLIPDADVSIATSWPTAFAVHNLNEHKGKKFYLIQDYEKWHSTEKYVNKSYTLDMNRVVVSSYLKDLLKEKFGSDSELILPGIDYDRFNNPDKKFGVQKRILFMDHLLENKNIEGAVRTVEKLKKEYPGLLFRSFGLRKFHSMPDYVEFIEDPDDTMITKIYCESDIFIYPSKYEGFGATPAEAMACKCAVVANSVAAIPEYAVHGETALLADPEDSDGLYKGVKFLLENEAELRRISLAGSKHIMKVLDWEKASEKFENLLIKSLKTC